MLKKPLRSIFYCHFVKSMNNNFMERFFLMETDFGFLVDRKYYLFIHNI